MTETLFASEKKHIAALKGYAKRAPKDLDIGPYTYPILWGTDGEYPKFNEKACWGVCDNDDLQIRLADPTSFPCQRRIAEIVLHEAFHAAYYWAGHGQTKLRGEEAQVKFFATIVTEIFGRNPKFFKWYSEVVY